MVRTVASSGTKAVGSKAPRKQLGGGSGSSSVYSGTSSANNVSNFGLCNHAKMWPTPSWQKGIGSFFKKNEKSLQDDDASSSSSSSSERMDADDVIVTSSSMGEGSISSSNSSSGGSSGSSASMNPRVYSDDEDKENIDPSSSPENNKDTRRSDSESPSPKIRRKANGKQKAGPTKRKKRMVLQEDSDYERDDE
jgi:hypothetical protein